MPNQKISPAYAGLCEDAKNFYLTIFLHQEYKLQILKKEETDIFSFLKKISKQEKIKIIAVGLGDFFEKEKMATKFWHNLDIAPHLLKETGSKKEDISEHLCKQAVSKYDKDHQPKIKPGKENIITPAFLTDLDAYKKYATEDEFFDFLEKTKKFSQKKLKMAFINATPAGGGVAIMRHAMMRLFNLTKADVSWHTLNPDPDFFFITKKKFHNVFQAVADPSISLTKKDKKIYEDWSKKNAEYFKNLFRRCDIIVIDDPQPAGLIPHIKKISPNTKIFYRSHIEIRADLTDKAGTIQESIWLYLWEFIKKADLFVAHPVPEFVPKSVPRKKLFYAPPSTDPLDGLNKKLSKEQFGYYINIFQNHLQLSEQTPVDLKRPYLIQIARFDPSKGIPDLIESYRLLRENLQKKKTPKSEIPQLLIIGNGSIDDPEGVSIYEETRQTVQLNLYSHISEDIKIARLPQNDQLLNALLDGAKIAYQLSHKEGFEFKITEALLKGKPTIIYNAGGMPLQIKHGETGYIADIGDTQKVADYTAELLSDKEKYEKMSKSASQNINHDFLTMNNSRKWLDMALK